MLPSSPIPSPEPLQGLGRGEASREGRKKERTSAVLPSLLTPLCTRSCDLSRISGSLCAHIPRPKTSRGLLPAINPPPDRAGRRLPTSSMGTGTALGGLGAAPEPACSLGARPRLTARLPPGLLVLLPSGFQTHLWQPQLPLGRRSQRGAGSPPPALPSCQPQACHACLAAASASRRPGNAAARFSYLRPERAESSLQCSERRGKGRKTKPASAGAR